MFALSLYFNSLFGKMVLLFVTVPLADLILLLMIARIHWLVSIALVIASGIFGAWLARRSGLAVMRQIRERLAARQLPTESLADGAIVLFAGGLLLTPGLITDMFGITMLLPWTRPWYRRRLTGWFGRRFQVKSFADATGFHRESDVVDAPVVEGHRASSDDDNGSPS